MRIFQSREEVEKTIRGKLMAEQKLRQLISRTQFLWQSREWQVCSERTTPAR
jgi:hypothetical protein